jgi:D-alanyl-lipoteichoic acid acyltransferase DltB (MBOAT superfamily)
MTFQIYFDFSGCHHWRWAAQMFNIRLPVNFNSPYRATDIQDFWRRWHITLSRFLRDYLYIPLGGNRAGNMGGRSLLATFLLGGLWHDASWTFSSPFFVHITLIFGRTTWLMP